MITYIPELNMICFDFMCLNVFVGVELYGALLPFSWVVYFVVFQKTEKSLVIWDAGESKNLTTSVNVSGGGNYCTLMRQRSPQWNSSEGINFGMKETFYSFSITVRQIVVDTS